VIENKRENDIGVYGHGMKRNERPANQGKRLRQPNPTPRFLMTEKEVSAYYGFSVRQLQQWRYLGRGPLCRKFGTSCRYLRSDVEAFIEAALTVGGK